MLNMPSDQAFLTRLTRAVLIGAAVVCASPALAQQPPPTATPGPGNPGFLRVQGQTALDALAPPTAGALAPLMDFRQEMRSLIEKIATYARTQNPAFLIVASDPSELIIKRDVQDEKIISPARTFMRSVDGVLFQGVYYGHGAVGKAPPPEVHTEDMERIALAKRNGLTVLALDFATKPTAIDEVYRNARKDGLIAAAAPRPLPELTELPSYPSRPNGENPKNILSMDDVRNFAFISDPAAFGRQDQFAFKLHDTNFDLLIVDPFSGREALSKRAVETLKYKKLGARRLVFARMDIGTAASYRYYWQPDWKEGSPPFISTPYPMDPDRYFVEYWTPEWQQVLFGDNQSYLYGLIAQGYDGVLLEGMRNYLAFEANVELQNEFAPLAAADK